MSASISNKKARFNYEIVEEFTAGISLMGSEVKSIRVGKASMQESFVYLKRGELFLKNMHVAVYTQAAHNGHEAVRDRKLLLNKREIEKISKRVKEKGYALVPLKIFINERGLIKVMIGLGKGKKLFDKRDSIKTKEAKRSLDRVKKGNW